MTAIATHWHYMSYIIADIWVVIIFTVGLQGLKPTGTHRLQISSFQDQLQPPLVGRHNQLSVTSEGAVYGLKTAPCN